MYKKKIVRGEKLGKRNLKKGGNGGRKVTFRVSNLHCMTSSFKLWTATTYTDSIDDGVPTEDQPWY